jgi:hypothetical protein
VATISSSLVLSWFVRNKESQGVTLMNSATRATRTRTVDVPGEPHWGASALPAIADLDITPAEDLVPGRQPVVLPFPGGAFVDRTCTQWVQVSPGRRFEVLELPGRCTVVDLVAELVAAPRVTWSRADAELMVAVLAERPGYAVHIPWVSA